MKRYRISWKHGGYKICEEKPLTDEEGVIFMHMVVTSMDVNGTK